MPIGETPRTSSQVILLLFSAAVSFSAFIICLTPLSIQTFILAESCAQNNTTTCCPHCLGLSTLEYGVGIGVASFLSVCAVLFSGTVIDLLGLPTAVAIVAADLLFGSTVFALSAHATQHHGFVLVAFTVARLSADCGLVWAVTLSQYIGIRYFESKWKSFAIGVVYSFAALGAMSGTLLGARIASSFGLRFVLWGDALSAVLPVCSAVGFALMFRYSKDIVSFESGKRLETEEDVKLPAATFIAQSLKAFSLDYWLIAFILSLNAACSIGYMVNVPFIQTELFGLSSVEISQNMAYSWIIKIAIGPLLGYLLTKIPIHLLVAFVGLLTEGVMLLALIIPPGSPLVSSLLLDVSYTILLLSLTPYFDMTAPVSALGLASTIMYAFDLLFTGTLCIVVGAVLNNGYKRASSVNAIYLLLGVFGVQCLLFAILTVRLKLMNPRKDREEV